MRRKNYGVFMALPGNDFSTDVMIGASKAAAEEDANLFIFPTGIIDEYNTLLDTTLYRYQYSTLGAFMDCPSLDGNVVEYGTITTNLSQAKKEEFLSQAGKKRTTLLVEPADDFPSFSFDNEAGIRDVIRHLIQEHNVTRIGYLSGPMDNEDARKRLNAFWETIWEEGLEIGEDYIAYGDFTPNIQTEVSKLLKRHPELQAVVCANDAMALATCDYLKDSGKKVGSDILVTGFDDVQQGRLYYPPLTTVKASASDLSYAALKALSQEDFHPGVNLVPTQMVKRLSCGCKPQASGEGESGENDPFRKDAIERIQKAERDARFFGEVEMMTREVLFYKDSRDKWLEAILSSFNRLGCSRSFFFDYGNSIDHASKEPWENPEYVYLRGSMRNEAFSYYDGKGTDGAKAYRLEDLFHSEVLRSRNRYDLLVLPIFFREKQIGLVLADCPLDMVRFAFQLGSMISNSVEMIHTLHTNQQITRELEQANQAKSQFLANMSHEIRTPINAIMGMNQMILREGTEPAIRTYAEDVQRASDNLLHIVNDILDFTKIEANEITLLESDYKLQDLVTEVVTNLSFKAKDKGLSFELKLDQSLPSVLHGDEGRIKQILINLLSNAVKYTKKGSVTFSIQGYCQGDDALLKFSVKDTGIGIKEEDLSLLFEKFTRIEEKRNRNIEGTGLGMNITAGLLNLMGSRLEIDSIYGEGSEFSFDLKQRIVSFTPVKDVKLKDQSGHEIYRSNYTAKGARILLVDDNKLNRRVVKNLLKKTEITIDEAENGQECLDMMIKGKYDLVLLDHMMPVMDGMEALRHIQKFPTYEKGKPFIVALTANAIVGVEKTYLDAGFDTYLSKPVKAQDLDALLIKHLPGIVILEEEA